MMNEFIHTVSEQLDIKKGSKESLDSWKQRVLYSSIGINMLAATYDYDDDSLFGIENNSVSMQHILKRGKMILGAYNALGDTKTSELNIPEYIRRLYIKTGYILHRSNRLTYPPTTQAKYNKIFYTRGQLPWTVTAMSGAGTYSNKEIEGVTNTLAEMFHLERTGIMEWYQAFERGITWKVVDKLPDDVEYINTFDSSSNSYWTTRLPGTGISFCRSKHNGERVYKLLRIHDVIEFYTLPSWCVDEGEYFRIALALRVCSGNPPFLVIKPDDTIAVIYFNHLLPSFEQNFVELYSWPVENMWFKRIISIQLLPMIVDLFRRMGYRICKGM